MKLYMFRTDELSETCRVSCQNKFVKSVHLVGFVIKKSTRLVMLACGVFPNGGKGLVLHTENKPQLRIQCQGEKRYVLFNKAVNC